MSHDAYAWARAAVKEHRWRHRCSLYRFEDGPLIQDIALATRPRRVLELGTLLGYTACCWAATGAEVVMVEPDPLHVTLARTTIAHAGLGSRAQVIEAETEAAAEHVTGTFDVVFVHADVDTPQLRQALAAHLDKGGALLVTEARSVQEGGLAVVEVEAPSPTVAVRRRGLVTPAHVRRPAAVPGGQRP